MDAYQETCAEFCRLNHTGTLGISYEVLYEPDLFELWRVGPGSSRRELGAFTFHTPPRDLYHELWTDWQQLAREQAEGVGSGP